MTIYDEVIREEATSIIDVEVVASGELTDKCPVAIWTDPTTGIQYGIKCAMPAMTAAANQVKRGSWGIAVGTTADGAKGKVRIKGLATVDSGGTANQVISEISDAGVVTNAAITGVRLLVGYGLSASASTINIF